MGAQTSAANAQVYMDRAIGLVNQMGAIQAQYGMYFAIQKIAAEAQLMQLKLPEAKAFANYIQTAAGRESFLQDQISRGVGTALDVVRTFKPGVSVGPGAGVNTTPGFNMGRGSPNWPVNT